MFGRNILSDTTAKHFAQRKAPVFGTFTLAYMQHAAFYIGIGYPKMTHFAAAQAATITKPDDKTVF
jgi:hypothetical protein